jgi:hypothetical protein
VAVRNDPFSHRLRWLKRSVIPPGMYVSPTSDRAHFTHALLVDNPAAAQKQNMRTELEIKEVISSGERRSAGLYFVLK